MLRVLRSGIAGFAGTLYAHYFRFVTVEQFEILMSSTILTMVVVGGMRTPWGPVVGAMIVITLESYLGPLGGWFTVVEGAIFVACVSTFRQGIAGTLGRLARRRAPTA